jgi:hypothetical protein
MPDQKLIGDQLFHALIEAAHEIGVDNVIWNRKIWSVQRGGPRPFVGPYTKDGVPITDKSGKPVLKNPHTDHIHVEFTRPGSQGTCLRFLETRIGIIRSGLRTLSESHNTVG